MIVHRNNTLRYLYQGMPGIIICLFMVLLSQHSAFAQAPPLPSEEQYVNTYLAALDTQARQEGSSAIFDRQLLYLAEISGNEHRLVELYKQVLDRIEAANSTDSIPALAAMLNTPDSAFPTPTQEAIDVLRKRASSLWYDLQWPDLSDEQRVAIALYGLYPDAPVQVWSQESATKVRELGATARGALYALIRDPGRTYDSWNDAVAVYETSQVLNDPQLAPADAEVTEIVREAGPYGKAVMLTWLARRQDSRAIVPLVAELSKEQSLNHLAGLAVIAAEMVQADAMGRAALVKALAGAGERLIGNPKQLTTDQTLFRAFASLSRAISRLDSKPEALEYFRKFLDFRKHLNVEWVLAVMDANPRYGRSIVQRLTAATKYAEEAVGGQSK